MTKDLYGVWHKSNNLNEDWAEVFAMRDAELSTGKMVPVIDENGNHIMQWQGPCPFEAANMAMVLLENLINKNIKTAQQSKKALGGFEDDFRSDVYLRVLDILGMNSNGTVKFDPDKISENGKKLDFATRMHKEIFGVRRVHMQGDKGSANNYQIKTYGISFSSIEEMEEYAKHNSDNKVSFEIKDDKKDVENEIMTAEMEKDMEVMRRICPITNQKENALMEVACFSKLLGGYFNLSAQLKSTIVSIMNNDVPNMA